MYNNEYKVGDQCKCIYDKTHAKTIGVIEVEEDEAIHFNDTGGELALPINIRRPELYHTPPKII